jgi:hypothetical protein
MLRLIGYIVHRLDTRGRERLAYRMLAGLLVPAGPPKRTYETR